MCSSGQAGIVSRGDEVDYRTLGTIENHGKNGKDHGRNLQKNRGKITASIHTLKRDVFISTCVYIITGINI